MADTSIETCRPSLWIGGQTLDTKRVYTHINIKESSTPTRSISVGCDTDAG